MEAVMTERFKNDARNIRKLIREAEASADESMIAFAKLKQAMLAARQNPFLEVHSGQRALLRLNQAEDQALAMSTNLLRVHDELSKIAVEKMAPDDNDIVPTFVAAADIAQPNELEHQ